MKHPKLLLFIGIATALLQHSSSVGQQTDTLATVFGVPITANEFVTRWELAVYPGKDQRAMMDSSKMRFLYSLIAEKLLARAPVDPGAAADSSLETMRHESEETFMRDALFRREVMNKVVITEQDMIEAVKFSAYDYVIDIFRFPDSTGAVRFLKKVRGADSSRVYAAVVEGHIGHDTLSVSFGELHEEVERSFFGRQPGFMSRPVRSQGVYAVIRILSRSTNQKYTSMSLQDRFVSLKKKIHERRMDADGWKYLVDVMRGIRVEVNPDQFYVLAGEIQAILRTHAPNRRVEGYHLTSDEYEDLKTRLAGRLDETLMRFPDGSLTVHEALAALPYGNFAPKDTTVESIERSLHAALRFTSQNHYLVRRAGELGLRDAPEVQSDVQMFVDAVRASNVAEGVRRRCSVTTAERDSFFSVHRDEILNDVRLLVRFATVRTVSEATDLLKRLETAWKEHASPPLDTTKILSRWVFGSEIGEYGAALALLSPGDVYGPIISSQGYTVFQLLDKKTLVADSSLAQSLEAAERKLLEQKRSTELDRYIAKLAGEASVQIHRAKVASTSVLPSQMYTIRYIGFGGRVNAVPLLTPREAWIRFVGREVQILP